MTPNHCLRTSCTHIRCILSHVYDRHNSASAAEDFFPQPGSLSARPGFVETIRPGLGGSQPAPGGTGGPLRSRGGFMRSQEKLCTGYGIFSQGSGNMLCCLKLACAFRDGFGSAFEEFGDICTVDLACSFLHELLRIRSHSDRGYVSVVRLGDFVSLCSTTFRAPPCLEGYGRGVLLLRMTSFDMLCLVCMYGLSRAFVFALLAGIEFV